jgi:hypothetical protein
MRLEERYSDTAAPQRHFLEAISIGYNIRARVRARIYGHRKSDQNDGVMDILAIFLHCTEEDQRRLSTTLRHKALAKDM